MKIIIPINPVTKKNSQRIVGFGSRHPRILPSKAYVKYEKDCRPFLIGLSHLQIDKPVNVKALYFRATKHRVDLCNLHEALCDVLVTYGIVKDDNIKIIASMDGSRVYYDKSFPRTEVYIEEIKDDTST